MSKFWRILRLQFKVTSGLSLLKYNFKYNRKEFSKSIALYGLLLFAIAQFLLTYVLGMNFAFKYAVMMNMPELLISIVLLAYSLVSLLLGTFSVLSRLFLSKDSEFYAALPVSPRTIFTAKLVRIYSTQVILAACFIVPVLGLYAVHVPVGFGFFLSGLLVLLLAPVFPLLISSILSMLFMGTASKTRNRDRWTYVFYFLFTFLVLAFQMGMNRFMPQATNADFISKLLSDNKLLIERVTAAYPPAAWMTLSMTASLQDRLINLGFLLAGAAAGASLCIWVAGYIYNRGSMAYLEAPQKNKKVKVKEARQSTPIKAIFKREWKTILKVPVYAMNSLAGGILLPIIMAMSFFSGNINNSGFSLKTVLSFVNDPSKLSLVVLILAGGLAFCGGINTGGATILSREGKSLWLLKIFPVSPYEIVLGKLIAAVSISIFCITIPILLFLAVTGNIVVTLSGALMGGMLCFIISALGVMVDFIRPKLDWSNYTQVIKQSANALFIMLIDFLVVGVFALLAVGLYKLLNPVLALFILSVILIISCAACYKLVIRQGIKNFNRLEG